MTVFVLMSLVVIRRANLEEALLEIEYEAEWKEYVSDVPKWVPRWGKRDWLPRA